MALLWNFGGFSNYYDDMTSDENSSGFLAENGGGSDSSYSRSDNRSSIRLDLGTNANIEYNGNQQRVLALFPQRDRILVGFALLFNNDNINGPSIISPNADNHRFYKLMSCPSKSNVDGDTDSNTQIGVGLKGSTGEFFLTRGSTIIATTSAGNLVLTRSWVYIELDIKINSTTGWAKMRVNGTELINFSGNTQNTANAYVNMQRWQRIGSSTTNATGSSSLFIQDILIMDDVNDGTPFYQHVGSIYHGAILPNGNEQQQLTRSSGSTNWSLVDDFTNTGDYVYGNSGTEDIYTLADLTGLQLNRPILAVIPFARAIQHDASPTTFKITLRQSSSLYESTNFTPITSTSGIFRNRLVLGTNPNNGGAAWTVSDLNSTRIGFKVTS